MRVLISGAAGFIGRHLTRGLEAEHDLRLGDVVGLDDSRYVPLDVTDPSQVTTAMRDIDAVVHLAIAAGYEGEFEDPAFNQRRFDVNVRGTHNMLAAASAAKVKRFVHTSSIMVVWGYDPPALVAADAPARPVGTYALTKYLAEELCCHEAQTAGLSVVCLRIAKPIDLADDAKKRHTLRPQWIAMPDLIQAYQRALTAPNIDFEIFTIVGEHPQRRWDLSKAERLLGYRPQYRLNELGYKFGSEHEPYADD